MPHPVSSNAAKLALFANYLAISHPVSTRFCSGKKWQVTTATPQVMHDKKITPIVAARSKKPPGEQQERSFNAFAPNALTICGKNKTIWTKPEL